MVSEASRLFYLGFREAPVALTMASIAGNFGTKSGFSLSSAYVLMKFKIGLCWNNVTVRLSLVRYTLLEFGSECVKSRLTYFDIQDPHQSFL